MISELRIDPERATTQIADFLGGYLRKTGNQGVVMGLSGGVDSAVAAAVARQALGKKNAKCVFMPDSATPTADYEHVDLLAEAFDLDVATRDITAIVETFGEHCVLPPDTMAAANIKARSRMVLLYAYANMTESLVCGTSNKSELMVGYFTKFGDGGVDIMPIGDLYKAQVWALARHLEVPGPIIDKPPSAGLFEGQTDEAELKMTYDSLDVILCLLEKEVEIGRISREAGVDPTEVERIRTLVVGTRHKRETAVSAKIY